MKFQTRKNSKKIIARAFTWHHICMLPECPYDHSAGQSENKAKLWWSDNILDFPRRFPAPSSTKVISIGYLA
jgi:hypothetical protein